MTHQLKSRDIIALGFMTFALFVGAGNIIFPPMVGLQAGEHVWTAAIGFLITAVGFTGADGCGAGESRRRRGKPEYADWQSGPASCWRWSVTAVGPLFATPRTATVSLKSGLPADRRRRDAADDLQRDLFCAGDPVSLYPGKLLDTVGISSHR